MKNKIFYFFILLLLTNCGFTPMYDGGKKLDYNIIISSKEGDKLINNLISDEILRFSNSDSQNKIIVKINSTYNKIVLTKNSKGSVTDYRIDMVANFEIQDKTKINNIIFKDKQDIRNNSDIFEQKNVEDITKRNFAISAADRFKLALLD
tara:strand:- start:594 stop:1043 length:450 start_codon:yes stop_codon:yes gene_type:complete